MALTTDRDPLVTDLPDFRELLAEGREAGRALERRRTQFHELRGVRSQAEFAERWREQGRIRSIINIGLPDWDATKAGLRQLWRAFEVEALTPPDCYMLILERRMGLPERMRRDAPQETGPALWSDEDWLELGDVVPIQPQTPVIGSPASFENALLCLRAGVDALGNFSEFTWRWPYWDDEVAQLSAILRAVGAVAALRADGVTVDSYLEDGFAGEFEDYASVVGWSLLERHLVDDLCGAAYGASFGGLTTDTFTRIAVFQAVYLTAGGTGPSSWYHGDTVGYSASQPRNAALFMHDALISAAAHLHYGWSSALLPVPLTECERVPTIEEIIEVHQFLRSLEPHAARLAERVDWSETDERAATLAEAGRRWCQRVMRHIETRSVPRDDPLAIMLAVRRIGRSAIEAVGLEGETERHPTDLARIGNDSCVDALRLLREAQAPTIERTAVALVSTDVHVFAKQALQTVLEDRGARVVDCGVSADPEQVVAVARREGCRAIVVTTHNGWALNFGRRLTAAIPDPDALAVLMGGVLNEDAPGSPVPRDVSPELRALGVHTTNDMVRLIQLLSELENT